MVLGLQSSSRLFLGLCAFTLVTTARCAYQSGDIGRTSRLRGASAASRDLQTNANGTSYGYNQTWTVRFEMCAPDGILRQGCFAVWGDEFVVDPLTWSAQYRQNGTSNYANERFPGPPVQVTLNDRVSVTLRNFNYQSGATIHWHGMYQMNTNWMDGVPTVTQCLTLPFQHFKYDFVASPAGTHWWHSHAFGGQYGDGVYGLLVVHDPEDPYRNDYDEERHMVVADYWHEPGSMLLGQLTASFVSPNPAESGEAFYESETPPALAKEGGFKPLSDVAFVSGLVNGKGRNRKSPEKGQTEVFEVEAGKRYRFRLVCAASSWAFRVAPEGHNMEVIYTNAQMTEKRNATSITCGPGDRFDFILTANQPVGNYRMDVSTLNGYNFPAIIRYKGAPEPTLQQMTHGLSGLDKATWWEGGGKRAFGLQEEGDLNVSYDPSALVPLASDDETVPLQVDRVVNVTVMSGSNIKQIVGDPNAHVPGGIYAWYLRVDDGPFLQYTMTSTPAILIGKGNNFTLEDVSFRSDPLPFVSDAKGKDGNPIQDMAGFGPNIVNLKLGQTVDVILNNPTGMAHPMHLHGNRFWLLGIGDSAFFDEERDASKLNEENPILVDGAMLPGLSWMKIRFKADNPGYWVFHCHIDWHMVMGMVMAFAVSPEEVGELPEDFPRCGTTVA